MSYTATELLGATPQHPAVQSPNGLWATRDNLTTVLDKLLLKTSITGTGAYKKLECDIALTYLGAPVKRNSFVEDEYYNDATLFGVKLVCQKSQSRGYPVFSASVHVQTGSYSQIYRLHRDYNASIAANVTCKRVTDKALYDLWRSTITTEMLSQLLANIEQHYKIKGL